MNLPLVKLSLTKEKTVESKRILNPVDAASIISTLTKNDADESFFVFAINANGEVNHLYLAAKGNASSVTVSVKDALRAAIIANADAVIFAHNHPTGNTTPSFEDKRLSKRLREACEIIGLQVLDFIIVGDGYYSESEKGA